jgi:hypothetical protein
MIANSYQICTTMSGLIKLTERNNKLCYTFQITRNYLLDKDELQQIEQAMRYD